ncbi:SHOCT domain-containing protein [Patescibacteria group bacterium]|nr:SHOCT domain-containing protein [Patescibacteria group bacterium]
MGDWGHMMGGTFMWIIFPVVILIILGVVIYSILQSIKSRSFGGSFRESPIDVLKIRYAKGEITKEEFEKMKKDLES